MKSFVVALAALIVFSVSAYASPAVSPASSGDELPAQSMTMCDGTMGMMCPMMGVNRGVIDVMKLQQKMAVGKVSPAEKKALSKEIDRKIAGLDSTLTSMKSMPMPCMQPGTPGAMPAMPGMAAPKR